MSDRPPEQATLPTAALNIIAAGVILTGLIYGADFLIPLVVSLIVVNVPEAMIERLERVGFPAFLAVPLAVGFIILALAGLVLIFLSQIDEFLAAWPRYFKRLQDLATSLLAGLGDDAVTRLRQQLGDLNLTNRISSAIGSAGGVFLNFLLVVLYTGFLLAQRGRIARRMISLGETHSDRAQTFKTLANISMGIRQYLFVKTVVSFFTGALSYVILKYLGVDFAEIWAVIIFLLNYIPSIGSVLGVIFPALLALVQFDTLEPFFVIVGVLAVVQIFIGNVVEPMMMGRSLNLSAFTVIVALMFWSAVWGVAGAFLAVPITAAFVILCRNLEGWQWVSVLLSNERTRPPRAAPEEA
jgi:AI-2 transport protein TqsA